MVVNPYRSFGHDKSSIPVPTDLDEMDNSADTQPPAEERTNLANSADRPKSYDATSLNHVHPEGTVLNISKLKN